MVFRDRRPAFEKVCESVSVQKHAEKVVHQMDRRHNSYSVKLSEAAPFLRARLYDFMWATTDVAVDIEEIHAIKVPPN